MTTPRFPRSSRWVHALLGLATFAAAGSMALGSSGCGSCAAACSSYVAASGPLALEAGMSMRVLMCLDDICERCDFAVRADDDTGELEVDTSGCGDITAFLDDGALVVAHTVEDEVEEGQVARVIIISRDGDELVDHTQSVRTVTDESICGNDCASTEIRWD